MLRMGKSGKPENEPAGAAHTSAAPAAPPPPPTAPGYAPSSGGVNELYNRPQTEHATPFRASTESEVTARDIKDGNLSGFVGSGTSLSGEVSFKAMLRVDGQLSGKVLSESGTLLVGTGGQLDANIEVAVAQIQGTINGDIKASQRIELGRAAKVYGNIETPSLIIEQGALFEGSCRMSQATQASATANPLAKSAAGGTTNRAPAPANSSASSAQPAAKTETATAENATTKPV